MLNADLPQHLSLGMQKVETLRYGENPHQIAAYYSRRATSGPLGGTVLGGKALSYNNILDLDAAWRAVSSFNDPTVVDRQAPDAAAASPPPPAITEAYPLALASDPVSAYGGVIAVNRQVDEALRRRARLAVRRGDCRARLHDRRAEHPQ